ncbi:MAG: polymer-forming cytoskeletal protein [Candidatus Marinimicrobia bacterium]|jgi:cytoskeletal protein CcmA (bactofilin family)|nr:polymer-forming cytoskeletal protein [Candidatus Neomarinimicrobiota bacterium]MBT3632607.1 polymer-forming cytoskeletal protein [Candidatus Neomarinimicrobiota bacterium]MBT3824499.1 polymer-forming cytoskeletal protein [Candidatus Neomarinimicrobiota bacterium]MBT4129166.1 polymer-forming cytoskeletal protein [Candidatus Neomarinimicrobiota bacterium]MBT4295203.1 polymer-forming cytoskeletal protein [Candidatus Neomarinimicrobiota bacterium]
MANRIHRIETIVGRGTHISGDMNINGSAHINGTVDGSIEATGFVTVSESGVVKGGIKGEYAIIGGIVGGNIEVKGKVALGKAGRLKGDVIATRLIIEDGAVFHGRSSMVPETSNSDDFEALGEEVL